MIKFRKVFFGFVVLLFCLILIREAHAVPNPNAINWRAAPQPFIRSLYVGVLGRQPESNAVVVNWAGQVNNSATSRRNVFWAFINSPEYQKTAWARQKREYKIYYKWSKWGRTRTWWVSKGPLGASYNYHSGPFTFGVGKALRNFYAAYYPR